MSEKHKLIIVDDHELFRQGIRMTLDRFNFINVIGEAENGKAFLDLIEKNVPDLVLMDIKMPVMNGNEASKEALKKYPNIKILALSMFGDEYHLESMLQSGVQGFALKNIDPEGLHHALKMLIEGKQYFSEELIPYFTNKFLKKETNPEIPELTDRELEILKLIATGLTNNEIGKKLSISQKTVSNHRANINLKTGAKNTASLLAFAIKHKLIKMK